MNYTVKHSNENFYLCIDGNQMHQFDPKYNSELLTMLYKSNSGLNSKSEIVNGVQWSYKEEFPIDPNRVEITTIPTGKFLEGTERRETYFILK